MSWGAVGGAAIGAAGSMIGGSKSSKSAAKQQAAAESAQRNAQLMQQQFNTQNMNAANQLNIDNAGVAQGMNQDNASWVNDLNKQNASWAQGMNQSALDQQTAANRLNTNNAFGGTREFGPDGTVTDKLSGADQSYLDALQGKQSDIVNNMSNQFSVNGDVMNAYKAINQPLLDQQRAKEDARLAAMGFGTGGSQAWGNAQDALNRNQVNSDQNAILQGFNSNLALQNLGNSQLQTLDASRKNLTPYDMNYAQQTDYAKTTTPSVGAINSTIAPVGGFTTGMTDPLAAMQSGQNAGAATQSQWNSLGKGAGDAFSTYMKSPTGGGKTGSASPGAFDASTWGSNLGK